MKAECYFWKWNAIRTHINSICDLYCSFTTHTLTVCFNPPVFQHSLQLHLSSLYFLSCNRSLTIMRVKLSNELRKSACAQAVDGSLTALGMCQLFLVMPPPLFTLLPQPVQSQRSLLANKACSILGKPVFLVMCSGWMAYPPCCYVLIFQETG